jgi:D-arabinose 1-dehydrogenase-like Zn-dependent alcohol dehydrogenase
MFAVIVSTCAVYGLTALPLARRLGLSQANPQGVLIIGAHDWARAMAAALQEAGHKVLLVDTNYANLQAARMQGLETFYGSALSEEVHEDLDLQGIGKLLALTSNDEVNSLAALEYAESFGRAQVYQLPLRAKPQQGSDTVSRELRGRLLFSPQADFSTLTSHFAAGATIKATPLTAEFNYRSYQSKYGESALPLFLVDETGTKLQVFSLDRPLAPQPGQTVISLIIPQPEPAVAAREQGAAS